MNVLSRNVIREARTKKANNVANVCWPGLYIRDGNVTSIVDLTLRFNGEHCTVRVDIVQMCGIMGEEQYIQKHTV